MSNFMTTIGNSISKFVANGGVEKVSMCVEGAALAAEAGVALNEQKNTQEKMIFNSLDASNKETLEFDKSVLETYREQLNQPNITPEEREELNKKVQELHEDVHERNAEYARMAQQMHEDRRKDNILILRIVGGILTGGISEGGYQIYTRFIKSN